MIFHSKRFYWQINNPRIGRGKRIGEIESQLIEASPVQNSQFFQYLKILGTIKSQRRQKRQQNKDEERRRRKNENKTAKTTTNLDE